MKKNPDLGKSAANGFRDARNDSSGSSVGLKRKLPNLGTQFGDARGRAPSSKELASTGGKYWPKAGETIPRYNH